MPGATPATGPDLSRIDDPEVRRALRAIQQEVTIGLQRHQLEIDALLEMMMEKHIGSLGEFKRHLTTLQQNTQRTTRIHDALAAATSGAPATTAAPARPTAH
jgi:hypothetical protein